MTLRQTAWFWVGANANLFFVTVGVIALEVGLEVWRGARRRRARHEPVRRGRRRVDRRRALRAADAHVHPRGVRLARQHPQRRPHLGGARGLRVDQLHLRRVRAAGAHGRARVGGPGAAGKVLATLLVLGASALIAVFGHATLVYLMRVFAVALTLVLVLVLAYAIGGVEWSSTSSARAGAWETVALILARRCRGRLRPHLLPVQRARLRPLPAGRDLGPGDRVDGGAGQRAHRAAASQ